MAVAFAMRFLGLLVLCMAQWAFANPAPNPKANPADPNKVLRIAFSTLGDIRLDGDANTHRPHGSGGAA